MSRSTNDTFRNPVARRRTPLIDSPFAILVTFGIPWLRRATGRVSGLLD